MVASVYQKTLPTKQTLNYSLIQIPIFAGFDGTFRTIPPVPVKRNSFLSPHRVSPRAEREA